METLYKYKDDSEVVFENDTVIFKLQNISSVNGMSMLSTLPFTVERLDDDVVGNITKHQSSLNYDYFGVVRNSLGAENHGSGSDFDGMKLLMGGGLFKLITGAGKEYTIRIITND